MAKDLRNYRIGFLLIFRLRASRVLRVLRHKPDDMSSAGAFR